MAVKTKKVEVPDEIYEHKTQNKKIEVYREQQPFSPREWDNYGVMVCQHKKYNLGDEEPTGNNHRNWNDVKQEILENNDVELILPLYLYDHSGITISTTPFNSHFDSMKVGFVYVTTSRIEEMGLSQEDQTEERLKEILEAEVETYDQYLRGDVWRFVMYEDGEQVDSCGGFFGDNREQLFKNAGENLEEYEKTGGEL